MHIDFKQNLKTSLHLHKLRVKKFGKNWSGWHVFDIVQLLPQGSAKDSQKFVLNKNVLLHTLFLLKSFAVEFALSAKNKSENSGNFSFTGITIAKAQWLQNVRCVNSSNKNLIEILRLKK